MPQYKKTDGYHDVIYATGKVMQEKIAEAVLKEYKKCTEFRYKTTGGTIT